MYLIFRILVEKENRKIQLLNIHYHFEGNLCFYFIYLVAVTHPRSYKTINMQ